MRSAEGGREAGSSRSGAFPTSVQAAFAAADALMIDVLLDRHEQLDRPILVGMCGAQGSGKSTTAARLAKRLDNLGVASVVLSLDDFYLTRAEREALGRDVHPLLETRGVPGTHDVGLACRTIDALRTGKGTVDVPRFDKSIDDRASLKEWTRATAPVPVVILEGWCVGARPIEEDALARPINTLERDEDQDGRWRRHVNSVLGGDYAGLFGRLDYRILLRAPDFDHVQAWRLEQEEALARTPDRALPPMDGDAIARFIAHYERLTRWIIADAPADLLIEIDGRRTPTFWRFSS